MNDDRMTPEALAEIMERAEIVSLNVECHPNTAEYLAEFDVPALLAEVERLTKARDEALDAVKKGRVVTPTQRGDRGWQANKTHCKHGHPLTPDNIRVRSDGRRQCKACQRAHVAKHDQKRRAVPTTGSR